MNQSLKLKLINSVGEFESLQADWNSLYERSNHSTIFSSWDWMFSWWEVFEDQFDRKLLILCLYQDDKLVGIAPFQIDKCYPKSLIQGKTLRFIGSGDAYDDRIVSQFQDFIVLPEMEMVFVEKITEYLTHNRNQWDFADFEFLLDDALILQCFHNNGSKIRRSQTDYGARFFVDDVKSFDEFQSKMGKRWRKMFVKKSRIMSRDGAVSIESTTTTKLIDPALKQLADMNCSRWKEKGEDCIFESSRFYDFHKRILHRLVPQGKASIRTLKMGDESLASYYIFEDKKQIHYYQSGFYTKYANRYSPLFLLVCNEIEAAIKSNSMFDFMYDDSDYSYKKEQYAADHKKMYRLKWTPQPWRFFLFFCAKSLQTNYSNICTSIKNKLSVSLKNNNKKRV